MRIVRADVLKADSGQRAGEEGMPEVLPIRPRYLRCLQALSAVHARY